jgi:hypothetical protein
MSLLEPKIVLTSLSANLLVAIIFSFGSRGRVIATPLLMEFKRSHPAACSIL